MEQNEQQAPRGREKAATAMVSGTERVLIRTVQPFTEMGACYGRGEVAGFPERNANYLVRKGWAEYVTVEEQQAMRRSAGSGTSGAPVAATDSKGKLGKPGAIPTTPPVDADNAGGKIGSDTPEK